MLLLVSCCWLATYCLFFDEQATCFCTLPRTRYCCHCWMLSISSRVSFFCIVSQGFCLTFPNLAMLFLFISEMFGHSFSYILQSVFSFTDFKFMLKSAFSCVGRQLVIWCWKFSDPDGERWNSTGLFNCRCEQRPDRIPSASRGSEPRSGARKTKEKERWNSKVSCLAQSFRQ